MSKTRCFELFKVIIATPYIYARSFAEAARLAQEAERAFEKEWKNRNQKRRTTRGGRGSAAVHKH